MSPARKVLGTFRALAHDIGRVYKYRIHISTHQSAKIKSYREIPTKKSFLTSYLGLIISGGPKYLHEHCDKRHRELGPIFRQRIASNELVFIADTDMIRKVIANEGPQPHHNVPEAWLLYNKLKCIDRGLFFQVGEPWLKLRRAFDKVLLADPTKIKSYSGEILNINEDLFKMWTDGQSRAREQFYDLRDVKKILCNWSIETTGLMLFGRRMGCIGGSELESIQSRRANELVRDVSEMFLQTSVFQIIPPKIAMKLNLKSWQKFEGASDRMISRASEYATEYIAKAKSTDSTASITRDLIDVGCLNDEEISRSMVDLIIAAADTTSNALQWIIYLLSRHPEVQAKIHSEIKNFRSRSQTATEDITIRSPYLHAVIKEVLRLYPTAPFLARTLDHEIQLGGYEIPLGTPIVFSLYTTSRMEKYFDHANEFRPERWLRDTGKRRNSAYASLPFGVGARMCIGRRMADLEMNLLIASMLDRFEIIPLNSNKEITIQLKMILEPSGPINVRLKPRSD